MIDKLRFHKLIESLDQKDPAELAKLAGDMDLNRYMLKVDVVHDADDAPAAYILVRVPQHVAGFPARLLTSPVGNVGLNDYLTRKLCATLDELARFDAQGVARHYLAVAAPSQVILPRTILNVNEKFVEARLSARLPLRNGLVAGDELQRIFFDDIPRLVNENLLYFNLDEQEVVRAVQLMEDSHRLRMLLAERRWVAFLDENARLPRVCPSDLPATHETVQLRLDPGLVTEVETGGARVRGLALPAGITVILGDVFSGRRELMAALAAGIYHHPGGDGRELTVSVSDAVCVRAEPGRSIMRVNLGVFMPAAGGEAVVTTSCAGAFLSQAAAVAEALEAGSQTLLFDEADSSSEFLAQGPHAGADGMVPLSACARQMADQLGVSIVVAGSQAARSFVPCADRILQVSHFEVRDITAEAKQLYKAEDYPAIPAPGLPSLIETDRWIVPNSLDATVAHRECVVEVAAPKVLRFGRDLVDLCGVEQLADSWQMLTIGRIIYYIRTQCLDRPRRIAEVLEEVDNDLNTDGLDVLLPDIRGDLARPRRFEIAAALNRLCSLRVAGQPAEKTA